ncbi:hypothetical protein AOLI_G00189540 [Acnodon oligacanthus]
MKGAACAEKLYWGNATCSHHRPGSEYRQEGSFTHSKSIRHKPGKEVKAQGSTTARRDESAQSSARSNRHGEEPRISRYLRMPSRTFPVFLLIAVTCPGHYAATETVSASAGERVALPCEMPNDLTLEEPLFWWRSGIGVICELTGENVTIYEAFKGRAEVSEEKLKDGDCSLILYNVNESDSGQYRFYKVGRKEELLLHVDLLVKAEDPTQSLTTAHKPDNLLQQTSSSSSAPDGQHISGWKIAGSVGGVVVLVVVVAVLGIIICLWKRKKERTQGGADNDRDNDASLPLNNSGNPQNLTEPEEDTTLH